MKRLVGFRKKTSLDPLTIDMAIKSAISLKPLLVYSLRLVIKHRSEASRIDRCYQGHFLTHLSRPEMFILSLNRITD